MLLDMVSYKTAQNSKVPFEIWTVDSLKPKLFDMLTHPQLFQFVFAWGPEEGWVEFMSVGEFMTLNCVFFQLAGFPMMPIEPHKLETVPDRDWKECCDKAEMFPEALKQELEYQLRQSMRENVIYPRFLYRRK